MMKIPWIHRVSNVNVPRRIKESPCLLKRLKKNKKKRQVSNTPLGPTVFWPTFWKVLWKQETRANYHRTTSGGVRLSIVGRVEKIGIEPTFRSTTDQAFGNVSRVKLEKLIESVTEREQEKKRFGSCCSCFCAWKLKSFEHFFFYIQYFALCPIFLPLNFLDLVFHIFMSVDIFNL